MKSIYYFYREFKTNIMKNTIKLNTDVKITFNKKGNIKKLVSPYDADYIINQPIFSNAKHNDITLRQMFKGFGEDFLLQFNN